MGIILGLVAGYFGGLVDNIIMRVVDIMLALPSLLLALVLVAIMALQCARELGARSVTAIDINPQKLELAKALGATHTCNSREMTA
ncbi:zinc-binding dehydrogenase, partial [Salmonella enterica subsp. enterica serovar Kentucky]|nr:zinc-binding dehydrogenase [Salmonella enterica subsp. enterica serovar Kentucky]